MTTKELIHKLLYQALLEIREDAYAAKQSRCFHLADLFHNVPLRLAQTHEANDYDELMTWITNRVSEKGIADWLKNTEDHFKSYTD